MKKVMLVSIIVLAVIMSSCSFGGGAVVTSRNDEIDQAVLDAITAIDDQVIENIKNNDADAIFEMSSEDLKKESSNIANVIGEIHEIAKDQSFAYQGRYYSKVKKLGDYSFTVNTLDNDPFFIHMNAVAPEIFVSLLKTNSDINDCLLSLIYVKQESDWKLWTLFIGEYSYHGMTAADLYEKAKTTAAQGTAPAALYLVLSNRTMHPSPFLQFKIEDEITEYSKEIIDSLNQESAFPIELKNASNAEIYGLDIRVVQEGFVPVIKYNPGIDISKEDEVDKTARDIHPEVTGLFSGLKENFHFFLYEAYSEPPADPNKEYQCFRTIVEQE